MSFNSLLSILLNVCPVFYIWIYCFYLSHPYGWILSYHVFYIIVNNTFYPPNSGFYSQQACLGTVQRELTQFQKVPADRRQDRFLCLLFSFLLSFLSVSLSSFHGSITEGSTGLSIFPLLTLVLLFLISGAHRA